MPTYQYLCEKCGTEFDLFQGMSERTLTSCPKGQCGMKKWGKGKVKRLIGAGAGIIFKGSGFYITDYRSDKYREAAKKDVAAPAASSDSKPASASKETKPAKTESKPVKPAKKT
jgi:putative FmdB family regulatory protein